MLNLQLPSRFLFLNYRKDFGKKINFNIMLTCLSLILCFLFNGLCSYFLRMPYVVLLNKNHFQTDLFKPVTTIPSQSGPGSNGMKGYSPFPRYPEQEPHHQMQFSVKPEHFFYLTHRWEPRSKCHSRSEWTWE